MRKIEAIERDIRNTEEQLYGDIVIEYMEIGYDVHNHPTPEKYQKEVTELAEKLNELYDELDKTQPSESW